MTDRVVVVIVCPYCGRSFSLSETRIDDIRDHVDICGDADALSR